jgi:membrane protease YdiL (CAAX protease family)
MVNDNVPAGRLPELTRNMGDAEFASRAESPGDGEIEDSGDSAAGAFREYSLKHDPNVWMAGGIVASIVVAALIVWASGASLQDFFVKLGYLLAFLPLFYGACALVQMTVTRPKTRYVIIGSFATFAFLIGLIGIFNLAVPGISEDPENQQRSGILLLVIAGATFVPMFKRVRLLLGRITPIDPNSTVDISGVIVALWIAITLTASLLTVDLEAIAAQTNITVSDSLISTLAYPALAFSLVGIWITRNPREAVKRLGLERISLQQIGISVGMVIPLLIFGLGIDAIGRAVQPDLYEKLQRVLESMSSNVTNPFVAVVIGFSAGIGEEILFRGAIQPRLGIWFTAILFAIAHTQYGLSFGVLGVFMIGVVLGYQRRYMSTTSSIITHGVYNTVAFLAAYYTGSGS